MSTEKQPVYLVRGAMDVNPILVPQTEMDLEVVQAIPHGQAVRVEIKNERYSPRLRAYWATLNDCIKATGCAPNVQVLHLAVKLGTNHVDLVRLSSGLTVAVPGSIAFDKMSEDEMVTFFESAQEYLAREHGFTNPARLSS